MSQQIHGLRATATGDISGFRNFVRQFVGGTRDIRQAWQAAASDVARASSNVVTAVAATATGIASVSAKIGFNFLSVKEQAMISFRTMLGGAENAKAMLQELEEFAAKTPFELKGLIGSTKRLLAYGFAAKEIIPTLRTVGDAAAAMGASPEVMDRMILAMGQMRAKGKVTAEEMRQLAETGVPVWEILSQKIGVSIPQAMKAAENGAISAELGINALLAGMNERFQNMMAEQSRTFGGLWSTIKDTADITLGTIFEPLYNAIRNGMAQINDPALGQALNQLATRLAGQMQRVAGLVTQAFGADKQTAINGISNAVGNVIDGILNLAGYVREMAPAWKEAWGLAQQWLGPLMEFLKLHPELIAAMLALKVTGLLGINQAALSLGKALMSTVSGFSSLNGSIKAVGFAAAVTGILMVARALYQANGDIRKFNAELEKTKRLSDKNDRRIDRQFDLEVQSFQDIQDPAARRKAIEESLIEHRKQLSGAEASAKGAAANVDRLSTPFREAVGNKVLEEAKLEASQAESRARAQQERVYRLEDELNNLRRQSYPAGNSLGALVTGTAQAGGTKGGGASLIDLNAKEKADLAKDLRSAQVGAIDREHRGFKETRDWLRPEATADQLRQGLSTIEGATSGMVEQMVQHFQSLSASGQLTDTALDRMAILFADLAHEGVTAAERLKEAQAATAEFHRSLEDFRGVIPEATLQKLSEAFATLNQRYQRGDITQEQYRDGVQTTQAGLRESQQFSDKSADLQGRLQEQGLSLTEAVLGGFQSRFNELVDQLTNGSISAVQFARATDQLQQEMRAAGDAAIKQKQAQERQRLASGQFTGAEVRQAIQDRLAQFQQSRLSQYAEYVANMMLGLGNGANNVMQKFNAMVPSLQQFGQGLNSTTAGLGRSTRQASEIDQQQAAAAAQLMNSVQGQVAFLQSQMALAFSNMPFLGGERQYALREQIDNWQRVIDELTTQAPPTFVVQSTQSLFGDPGLASGGGVSSMTASRGSMANVAINFPNVTKISQQEVSTLMDQMNTELRRKGARPLY